MTDERDEIRARIDIVDLVGREIQLKRAGRTYKGLCPFHPDKNPSFTVNPETGRYKCWSCGEAGDIFTWEMKRRNVDFVEALQTLAKHAGIELRQRGPAIPASVRQQQEAAMSEALAFFREQFQRSASAKEYCERRGIEPDVLLEWEIGYAPDVGEALAVRLKKQGFSLAECKTLFLVDQDPSGGYYDKFRGRLMFPIRDEKGTLVAFGGRVLGDGTPKYINSSDTPLYRKGRVLYGMLNAKETIGKLRQAVLVEGYLDVIACHRAGVKQAIASLGTALSEDHAKLLKRWCDEVVVLYDSDDAGRKAAERAIEVLRVEGLKVRVALMPQGEDPDTLLKTRGPAAVKDAVEGALTPIEYRLQALRRKLAYDQDDFWAQATTILAEAASQAEFDRHVAELAPFYPWQRNPARAMETIRRQALATRSRLRRGLKSERPAVLEEHHTLQSQLSSPEIVLLRAFLSEPFRTQAHRFACAHELFETPIGVRLSQAIAQAFPEPPQGRSADWLHRIQEDDLRQVLSDLTLDFRAENLSAERLIDSVARLKDVRDQRELEELRRSGADRNQIFQKLKAKKPDPRAVRKDDDRLF